MVVAAVVVMMMMMISKEKGGIANSEYTPTNPLYQCGFGGGASLKPLILEVSESEEMKIFTSTLTHHCFVPGVDTYGGESHGDTESAKSPRESLSVERLFGTDLLLPCLASVVETPGHDPTPKLHGSSRASPSLFFAFGAC